MTQIKHEGGYCGIHLDIPDCDYITCTECQLRDNTFILPELILKQD